MKIDYLDDVTLIMDTARSVQVTKTCSALKGLGVDVQLVALKGRGTDANVVDHYDITNPFKITRHADFRQLGSIWCRSILAFHVAMSRANVIYTRDLGVAYASHIMGKAFVYEMHSLPIRPIQKWFLRQIANSPHLKAVTAITHLLRFAAIEQYGLPEARVHVVACSADVNVQEEAGGGASNQHGRFKVGYIGHLYPGKGGGTIASLAKRFPQVEFHIVGELKDPVAFRDVGDNVVWHGIKSHKEAMNILRDVDCAIAPYSPKTQAVDGKVISDWFSPLKVFEYMAASKPIMCSNLPVIREVLEDEQTALLVEPGDDDAWAAALTRLREDDALRTQLGRNAFERLTKEFSYARRAEKIISIIQSAAA